MIQAHRDRTELMYAAWKRDVYLIKFILRKASEHELDPVALLLAQDNRGVTAVLLIAKNISELVITPESLELSDLRIAGALSGAMALTPAEEIDAFALTLGIEASPFKRGFDILTAAIRDAAEPAIEGPEEDVSVLGLLDDGHEED